MSNENLKLRVEKELSKMGYSDNAKNLIDKYWEQTSYLSKSRDKALYMIASK
jgi:hypothetical protein